MARTKSSADVRVEGPRCPYCHDGVHGEDEKHGCSACMAWHHKECWNEAGNRCATCGQHDVEELEVLEDEPEEAQEGAIHVPAAEFPRAPVRVGRIVIAALYGLCAAFIICAVGLSLGGIVGKAGPVLGLLLLGAALAVYFFVARWVFDRLSR